MDRTRLIQRILDELTIIKETVAKIVERLEKIKTALVEYQEEIETTIKKNIVDCYHGIETIFCQIALDVDLKIPDGSRWHKELLTQMAETQTHRQSVISKDTFELLQELLEFCHVFNHIYAQKLVYEKTEKISTKIKTLYNEISSELETFTTF